ncbi:hypothetical protein LRS10_21330 [Phenylobacterium sp. J426]|uniref:hypothetical protein n=1 Tax=Phenylobacterium sp. J426 TaxID=2898439 RepID=UPI002150EA5E|nr:hypothetical protein [Phenylobacterium sp. J426]MCR5876462.1 hypothetical protein [Phenylobacterium sp. J426]
MELVGLPPTNDPRGVSGEVVIIFANGEKVFEGMVYNRSPVVAIHNLQPGAYVFTTAHTGPGQPGASVTILPRIAGTGGDDMLVAPAWATALFGAEGDDTLVGGAGADLLYGGPGADLFAVGLQQTRTGGTLELFRNGASPSDRANDRAWSNYEEQAFAAGFTEVVGHTAGGRALYGRLVGADVSYDLPLGVDMIRDFNPAEGDQIALVGVTDLQDVLRHLTVTRDGDGSGAFGVTTLALAGETFLKVQTASAFDAGWFVI